MGNINLLSQLVAATAPGSPQISVWVGRCIWTRVSPSGDIFNQRGCHMAGFGCAPVTVRSIEHIMSRQGLRFSNYIGWTPYRATFVRH